MPLTTVLGSTSFPLQNPTCSTCSEDPSPLFINQRYNPAWGVDDDAPGEEMAEDDLPSLHESQMEPPPDLDTAGCDPEPVVVETGGRQRCWS